MAKLAATRDSGRSSRPRRVRSPAGRSTWGRAEQAPKPKLVIDATGVGVAVVDMFLTPEILAVADVVPLTITAGEGWRKDRWGTDRRVVAYWVAKKATGERDRGAAAGGAAAVPAGGPAGGRARGRAAEFPREAVEGEQRAIRGQEGKTDDLILAVAMALWVGRKGRGRTSG